MSGTRVQRPFLSGTDAERQTYVGVVAEQWYCTDTDKWWYSDGVTPGGKPFPPQPVLSGFSTGDAKLTYKTVADAGWVMLNDGTIGSATSGATTLASAAAQALFTLLWNNILNTYCPVSGGRGASPATDWTANKTIGLPIALGRAIAVAGVGAGLTAWALGQTFGEETHLLTVNEIPSHIHTGGSGGGATVQSGAGVNVGNYYVGNTTAPTGGGQPHNNLGPRTFLNVMICL